MYSSTFTANVLKTKKIILNRLFNNEEISKNVDKSVTCNKYEGNHRFTREGSFK